MKSFQLDDQQHATVIAALRYFQQANSDGLLDSWMEDLATNGGAVTALDAGGIDALIEHLQFDGEDDDPTVCDSCGAPTDDGEGYDGLCGNCADVAELHHGRDDMTEEANEAACREDRDACETCGDALGDDSYEGLCSDCAEREVEKMSSRGMAANPKPPTEDA